MLVYLRCIIHVIVLFVIDLIQHLIVACHCGAHLVLKGRVHLGHHWGAHCGAHLDGQLVGELILHARTTDCALHLPRTKLISHFTLLLII